MLFYVRIVEIGMLYYTREKVYGSTIIRNLWNVQPFDKKGK